MGNFSHKESLSKDEEHKIIFYLIFRILSKFPIRVFLFFRFFEGVSDHLTSQECMAVFCVHITNDVFWNNFLNITKLVARSTWGHKYLPALSSFGSFTWLPDSAHGSETWWSKGNYSLFEVRKRLSKYIHYVSVQQKQRTQCFNGYIWLLYCRNLVKFEL